MKRHTQRAFSLYELLISLAIIAIALGIALPALSTWLETNKEQALRDQLHASLYNARTQAILRNASVEFCATGKGANCGSEWRLGWSTWLLAKDRRIMLDTYQTAPGSTLAWAGFGKNIRFLANGSSPASNGRFYQCRGSTIAWQLVLNRQGRVRVASRAENESQAFRCTK